MDNDTKLRYMQVVKGELDKLEDSLLIEDTDLLCQYIVTRFLKTSPHIHDETPIEQVKDRLQKFVENVYPILATFVTVINSSPVAEMGSSA